MIRLLVATDGSEAAERAVEYAARRCKRDDAELLIVNVISHGLPETVVHAFTPAQRTWLNDLLMSLSAKTLTEARDRALQAGAPKVLIESRSGEVAQGIIDVASDQHVDAIIVGKRGAGRVAGLLLGSVSQKLVSLAPLPVTVIP